MSALSGKTNMAFRPASAGDAPRMHALILQAKEVLRAAGVDQWQEAYPELADVEADIADKIAYVATVGGEIAGIASVTFDGEAAYLEIEGAWRSEGQYATVHRMVVDNAYKGKGLSKFILAQVDEMCAQRGVGAIRVDTHPDNAPMNHLLEKCGYVYCGIIQFQGGGKCAYDKVFN